MKPAYSPHQIPRDKIRALHNDVLVADMEFDTRITQAGLILPNDNGTTLGIRPRWGRVYAVGNEQQDVTVGQWILIEHGRWTRGIKIEDDEGEKIIRRVDTKCMMMVSDEPPPDDVLLGRPL